MGRPLRIEYPGALYHVISRGNEGREIFGGESDRKKFLNIVAEYHSRHGILIHAYTLMGNHYHLTLETPRGNLIRVMHGINSRYTGFFNRKYKRKGHLLQGRYRAILVDKDDYLVGLSRYIHLNPVKAGLAERPEEYIWSSYPGYIRKGLAVPWVEYSWILSQFGHGNARARKRYRDYVELGLKKDDQAMEEEVATKSILGTERFIAKIRNLFQGKMISEEIPERRRVASYPDPRDLINAVTEAMGTDGELIKRRGEGRNVARKIAIYLVKRFSALNNREVGKMFGGIHYSAVSQAARRFEKAMEADQDLQGLVGKILSNVKT